MSLVKTKKVLLPFSILFFLASGSVGCKEQATSQIIEGDIDLEINPIEQASCGEIAHGESISQDRFESETVAFGDLCQSQIQISSCTNGELSDFTPNNFQALTCEVLPPATCGTTPNGGTQTRTQYQADTVPFGQICQSQDQVRTCVNGTFSSYSPNTYSFATCQVLPPASCGTTPHNGTETRTRYLAASVPMGQTCQSQVQTRTCSNGNLSGYSPNNYQFSNCLVVSSSTSLPDRTPSPLGIRQIHSGHSLTDNAVFQGTWPGHYALSIERLDNTVNVYNTVGKSTIPGSPMRYRWQHAPGYGAPDAKGDIANWDLLVITEGVPFSLGQGTAPGSWWYSDHLDSFRLWVENTYQNGNGGQGAEVILYASWTDLDQGEAAWRADLDTYQPLWEQMADYGPANIANANPVYIIPANLLMMRIYDDLQLNQVPGLTQISDLFTDTIHLNGIGSYAVSLMHLAVIHHVNPSSVSPTGLGLTPEPSAQLTQYLQSVVWEIARDYDRAGVP